jgi:type 1 glutamine amidotransferase
MTARCFHIACFVLICANGWLNAAPLEPTLETPTAPIRVLSIGGGSSHDFNRWFNENDSAIIAQIGAQVHYTEKVAGLDSEISANDVIYFSTNQALDFATRTALLAFSQAGHGLVIIHAGGWANWPDWPEFAQDVVGGVTRQHDAYAEFEVMVVEPGHPLMKDLPATFKVTDELYHFERDPQATTIQVLATAKNPNTGASFPAIWVLKNPKSRIVCITLGHDGATHQNPIFQSLLKNSIRWAAEK